MLQLKLPTTTTTALTDHHDDADVFLCLCLYLTVYLQHYDKSSSSKKVFILLLCETSFLFAQFLRYEHQQRTIMATTATMMMTKTTTTSRKRCTSRTTTTHRRGRSFVLQQLLLGVIVIIVLFCNTVHGYPFQPKQQQQQQQQLQSISNTPILICPGFGNDSIDYYEPLQQSREKGFISALERRGFNPNLITTIPIKRTDWIRVAGGLFDWNFYTNSALPTGNGYGWYIQRFRDTIEQIHTTTTASQSLKDDVDVQQEEKLEGGGGRRILVIGHSAGGWLARAAMADGKWLSPAPTTTTTEEVLAADRICGLVTVGAIHKPPNSITTCVTRGALAYTDQVYPGAFLKNQGIGYVSVGGNAIVGDNSKPSTTAATSTSATTTSTTDADNVYAQRGEGSASRVAYTSYEAVCGRGDVTGDGVVPLEWTQLEGAQQLRLDGVCHSINEAGTTLPSDRWYGSEDVIDLWLPTALQEAGIAPLSTTSTSSSATSVFDLGNNLQQWASGIFQQQK